MRVGEVHTWRRTFGVEDVHAFSRLSGDEGHHHVVPDDQGRLMVQGLLTATLPSKIGGDLDFIAGEMTFRFLRPVFVGDSVACEVTIEDLSESAGRLHLACRWSCSNQDGDVVMTGGARGVILDRRPPAGIDP